ncbi:hypothetical protein [Ammoniphilus resinae]|uniref:Mor transcription activator domain-containing protein n=1 Tax=Ammoniphilus resinae TaxID=861532 RepID=A0ABS4GXX0_9BACL|nr:hypothetical protein [Ammoniphilus resinae]MBP1935113.1 hypothetical protein [Ammoniphilus resinae]
MEISRALEIIGRLAQGKDPFTSQELPKPGPFHQEETQKALYLALDGVKVLGYKMKRAAELPPNSGKPWVPLEDQELIRAYKCGHHIQEIAKKHQRTEGAIMSRLVKLGVIRIASQDGVK